MRNDSGEYIRHLRKEHGMSQEQLARRVGVSQVAVSEWERGVALPSKAKELAEALEVDPKEFVRELTTREVIDDPVEQAIRLQAKLAIEDREALVTVYRRMIKGS